MRAALYLEQTKSASSYYVYLFSVFVNLGIGCQSMRYPRRRAPNPINTTERVRPANNSPGRNGFLSTVWMGDERYLSMRARSSAESFSSAIYFLVFYLVQWRW